MQRTQQQRMWLSLLLLIRDDGRLCSKDKLGILNRKAMDGGVEQRANWVKVKDCQVRARTVYMWWAGSVHIYL
jgi:hypothetical protein